MPALPTATAGGANPKGKNLAAYLLKPGPFAPPDAPAPLPKLHITPADAGPAPAGHVTHPVAVDTGHHHSSALHHFLGAAGHALKQGLTTNAVDAAAPVVHAVTPTAKVVAGDVSQAGHAVDRHVVEPAAHAATTYVAQPAARVAHDVGQVHVTAPLAALGVGSGQANGPTIGSILGGIGHYAALPYEKAYEGAAIVNRAVPYAQKTERGLATMGYQALPGLYDFATVQGRGLWDAAHQSLSLDQLKQSWEHPLRPQSFNTDAQNAAIGQNAAMKDNFVTSFEHPGRDPAATLVNFASLLSLGAGGIVRGAAGAGALREVGEANALAGKVAAAGGEAPAQIGTRSALGRALGRPADQGGSLLHKPLPGTETIYVPGGRPAPVDGPLELAQQEADRFQGHLAENDARHHAAGIAPSSDVAALVRQRKILQDNGQPVPPELNEAIKLGRERARLRDGADTAEQRLSQVTDDQARFPRGATPEGPVNAIPVNRLLSPNPLVRAYQRRRNSSIQDALFSRAPSPRTPVGKAFREVFSPQSTIGREMRAQRRVESGQDRAPITAQQNALHGVLSGLSRGEQAAIGHIAIEGDRALVDPAETVGRHISTHEGYIEQGKDVEANQAHITNLKLAQAALEKPSPRFIRALELTRHISHHSARQLIENEWLTVEQEAGRRANIASLYQGAKFTPHTDANLGRSEALERAGARVDRLQKAYDRLEKKGKRGGYIVAERPRTVEEAHKRLAELEKTIDGVRAGVQAKMFEDKLTPEEAVDQRDRNKRSGIAERQAAGLTRTGMAEKRSREAIAAQKATIKDLEEQAGGKGEPSKPPASDVEGTKLWNRYVAELNSDHIGVADAERIADLKRQLHERAPAREGAAEKKLTAARAKLAKMEADHEQYRGKRLRSGASGRKVVAPTSTVKEDRAAEVDREIHRLVEKHAGEPWAQALRQQMDELDALRDGLAPSVEEAFGGGPARSAAEKHGTTSDVTFRRSAPSLERMGGATSVAKDELEHAATRAENARVRTGFVGKTEHEPPPGSFFVPMSARYTLESPHLGPGFAKPGPGEYGFSPPDEGRVISKQPFTGESVENARFSSKPGDSIALRGTKINQLLRTKQMYDELERISVPARRSSFDIPLRTDRAVKTELKQFFTKVADHLHASPEEQLRLDPEELSKLQELVSPKDAAESARVGETIEGVRWVDRRLIAPMTGGSPGSFLGGLVDTINTPFRFAQLYSRPAYMLNLIGNLGMLAWADGGKAAPALRQAVKGANDIGQPNLELLDSIMGASRSRAQVVPTGLMHKTNERVAEGWNRLTDLYSRRAAWYAEAARHGFRDPEAWHRLLNDPKHHDTLVEVTRRANKNIVDYDSLTPIERNSLRRIIYFYPWVSRGTLWALRALVEHPAKAFTTAQLAKIAEANSEKVFGQQPKWAEELGLIPVGKADKNGVVPSINLSSLSTFSTGAGTIEGLLHPGDKDVGLLQNVTPAVQSAMHVIGVGNGGKPQGGVLGKIPVLGRALASLPEVQAARRSGHADWLAGEPSETYPDTGVGPAAGPFTIGGVFSRGVSTPALHEQAEKEKDPVTRAADRVQAEQVAVIHEAERLKLLPKGAKLPANIVEAYKIQEQRMTAYAKLGSGAPPLERLKADVELGKKLGLITPTDAAAWVKAGEAHPELVQKGRRWINDHLFGGKDLTRVRTYIRAHGGDVTPPPGSPRTP